MNPGQASVHASQTAPSPTPRCGVSPCSRSDAFVMNILPYGDDLRPLQLPPINATAAALRPSQEQQVGGAGRDGEGRGPPHLRPGDEGSGEWRGHGHMGGSQHCTWLFQRLQHVRTTNSNTIVINTISAR